MNVYAALDLYKDGGFGGLSKSVRKAAIDLLWVLQVHAWRPNPDAVEAARGRFNALVEKAVGLEDN